MLTTKQQFGRFAAGGALGTACHYVTLVLLVELLKVPVVPGTLAGFLVGAVVNYVLARRFVFRTKQAHGVAVPRFLAVAAIGAVINTAIVSVTVGAGTHYLIAQVLATLVVLVWNFLVNKHWTFGG